MADNGPLRAQWSADDSERQSQLDRAREAAALSKPWLLPPVETGGDDALPDNYQSLGSRGLTSLEGRVLLAMFPPGQPWFGFTLAPEIEADPTIPAETKQAVKDRLFLREVQVQATLESAGLKSVGNRQRRSFRSRKRTAISMALAVGDVLEQLTDDYRIKTYRLDQYVTRRDSSTDVLYHLVKEEIDALKLSDDRLARANLSRSDLEGKAPKERIKELFTLVEWQPSSKRWVIRQELDGTYIGESEETVSPYFATSFELVSGENYGRGFIELNIGDLRSHDTLRRRKLDFAALASRMLTAVDQSSEVVESDLEKQSGEVIRCRVQGGEIQDIAMFKANQLGDFSVVNQTDEVIHDDLAKAMMLESEAIPQQDRVTALQVSRIAQEIEGALGGFYSSLADDQQIPLVRRCVHQLERDGLLPPIPGETVDVNLLNGVSALARQVQAGNIITFVQTLTALGEPAMQRIDMGVLTEVLKRYTNVHEPGLVKSDEQVQADRREAALAQLALEAGQQTIETSGAVAEQTAAAQLATQNGVAT